MQQGDSLLHGETAQPIKSLSDDMEARWVGMSCARGLAPSPANLDRVCRQVGPEAARWAFAQWDLRVRAKAKFTRAEDMLFTREALEQSTAEPVANFHASLFPRNCLVADLTCGIGGDAIALARRGPVVAFEQDEERAGMARHNLRVHGFGPEVPDAKADVLIADCLEAAQTWEYAFADPARRVEGRRTLDPSEFCPDPNLIATRFETLRLGVMKLSPLLPDMFLEALGAGLLFVSFEGECREALVICGREAVAERCAVLAATGERLPSEDPASCGLPHERAGSADAVSAYLFDADPAAVRAHSLGTLCTRYGLWPVGDSRGYLTGPELVRSPWLRPYRVLIDGKADLAATRRALRELGASTPEIKQRHAGQDADALKKQLRMDGDRVVSLAIWPIGRSLRHTILEQV